MHNYTSEIGYPDIILHDCIVEHVQFSGTDIVLELDNNGFWIAADNPLNHYKKLLRTDKSEILFKDVDLDFSCAAVHTSLHSLWRPAELFKTSIRHEISIARFASMVNRKKLRLEIVDEYYTGNSSILCGYSHTNNFPFVKLQLELYNTGGILYSWNKIYENHPW